MSNHIFRIIIIIAGALFFIPFLGNVHLFDWDEINFAEAAREMIVTGNYSRVQIDFKAFWEKPPFFIWMQAISMQLFGINEFAARLPNAITGILSLLILFNIGEKLVDRKFGLLWALVYAGSLLPHFYFKSGIIDPVFNLFIFGGIYQLSRHCLTGSEKISSPLLWSGFLIGLAILTKGPAAGLIAGICISIFIMKRIIKKEKHGFSLKNLIIFMLIASLTAGTWFTYEWYKNGFWFFKEFISYQIRLFETEDAGHGGPFFYHFIVLFIGCFPISTFASIGIYQSIKSTLKGEKQTTKGGNDFDEWMHILFWVVLIIFSIVKTKIVHYSSLAYFPLSWIGCRYLYNLVEKKEKQAIFAGWGIGITSILIGLAMVSLPLIGKYKDFFIPYIDDVFVKANLKAAVHWSGWEILPGIIIITATISSLLMLKKEYYIPAIPGLFGSVIVSLQIFIYTVAPKIERYTQGAAIDFYKSKKGENCTVNVIGFKSYAHLFYTEKMPETESIATEHYFVSRIDRLYILEARPDLKEIGRKNGFVFLSQQQDLP